MLVECLCRYVVLSFELIHLHLFIHIFGLNNLQLNYLSFFGLKCRSESLLLAQNDLLPCQDFLELTNLQE